MHTKLQVQTVPQCFRSHARAPKRAIVRQNSLTVHAGTLVRSLTAEVLPLIINLYFLLAFQRISTASVGGRRPCGRCGSWGRCRSNPHSQAARGACSSVDPVRRRCWTQANGRHGASALQRGYKVRAVVRNAEKAAQVFGSKTDDKLEVSA